MESKVRAGAVDSGPTPTGTIGEHGPLLTPERCPFCGADVSGVPGPSPTRREVWHMNEFHKDIIEERWREAGFVQVDGVWIDTLADPND